MLSGDWSWWSGLKPSNLSLRVTVASPQDLREARRSPRYLELYLVADHTLVRGDSRGLRGPSGASAACHTAILLLFQFLTQHQDLNHTKQRLLEIANYVDQILRTLDIHVALTGLEVWTEQDQSPVMPDANATLWAFLQWRRRLWTRRPHDSTQLLTWVPPVPTRVPRWAAPPPGGSAGHPALCPQGPRFPRQHRGPGSGPRHVPCGELWRREHGELRPRVHAGTGAGAPSSARSDRPHPPRITRSSPLALQLPWPMR